MIPAKNETPHMKFLRMQIEANDRKIAALQKSMPKKPEKGDSKAAIEAFLRARATK